jgi:hypothetical protein
MGVCKSRRGDKKDEAQHDSKKTTAGTNHFTINRMKMSEKSGKISRVSQPTQNLMKKQQNMKKLHHKVWDEKENIYIKMKIRMCVDILAYKSHKPCVQLSMMDKWYAYMGPSKQQKDIVLKTSITDTGRDQPPPIRNQPELRQFNSSWKPGCVLRQGQGGAP